MGVCSSIFRWAIHQKVHSFGWKPTEKKTKIGQSIHVPFKLRRTHTEPPRTLCTHSTDGFLGGILLAILEIAWVFYDFSTLFAIIRNFGQKSSWNPNRSEQIYLTPCAGEYQLWKKQCKAFFPFKQIDFDLCQERRCHTVFTLCALCWSTHTHSCKIAVTFCVIMSGVCVCLCVRVGLRICGFFLNASHVYN